MKYPHKVAIVHDILLAFGGSERTLLEIFKIYPSADLFTFFYSDQDKLVKKHFGNKKIHSSFFQRFPNLHRLNSWFSVLKVFSWIYFRRLNLDEYDLIISSSHSYNSKIVKKSKSAIHLSYVYTPPKYLYQERNELYFVKSALWRVILYPFFSFMRRIDQFSAHQPDVLIACSKEVQKRILHYYHLTSTVIYPPVKWPKVRKKNTGNYYLSHSRLVKQKNIDLIINACNKFKFPLLVVGDGPELAKLEKLAGSTVVFTGQVPDDGMPDIYSQVKALIVCSEDEDFGLTTVEAQSYGIPVVAYRSGGSPETVDDGKTGVLFDQLTIQSLKKGIDKLASSSIRSHDCIKHVSLFKASNFRSKIINIVKNQMDKSNKSRIN